MEIDSPELVDFRDIFIFSKTRLNRELEAKVRNVWQVLQVHFQGQFSKKVRSVKAISISIG